MIFRDTASIVSLFRGAGFCRILATEVPQRLPYLEVKNNSQFQIRKSPSSGLVAKIMRNPLKFAMGKGPGGVSFVGRSSLFWGVLIGSSTVHRYIYFSLSLPLPSATPPTPTPPPQCAPWPGEAALNQCPAPPGRS